VSVVATATAPATSELDAAPGAGRMARRLAEAYVTAAVILGFGAVSRWPPRWWYAATFLAVGALLLAPVSALRRIVVVGPTVLLCLWSAATAAWTTSLPSTLLVLRTQVLLVVALLVVASLLPVADLLRAWVRGIGLALAVTAVYVVVEPATRYRTVHGALLETWRGGFVHKQALATFAAFALPALFAFAGRRRTIAVAAAVVLLLGTRSATGLIAAALATAVWLWLGHAQRVRHASRAGAVAAALLVVLASAGAVAASLSSVASAFGKDTTLTGRTEIWGATIDKALDRPLQGFGTGALFNAPTTDTLDIWRAVRDAPRSAHNGLLQVQVDLGLVGVVLVLVLVLVVVVDGVRLFEREPRVSRWMLTSVAALVPMSVSEPVLSVGGWIGALTVMRIVAVRTAPAPAPVDPTERWAAPPRLARAW
jgi:O-antigen ligase